MSTIIQPLADRVVVQPVAAAERSKGGIVIPEVAKEKPQQGIVVAVGPGRVNDIGMPNDMTVRVGDRVLHGMFSGTEIEIDDVPHVVLREADIMAIVRDTEASHVE